MKFYCVVFCLLVATPLFAQETKFQAKTVIHAPVPSEPGWFVTGWNITNIRGDSPDNINLMLGVGRKLENGWVELMVQRQYAIHTNQWLLDFRLLRKFGKRVAMFVEVSPFLEKRAVAQIARVEYRVGPINLMVESENIWERGEPNLLGIGPGLSLPPRKLIGRMNFAPAISWQLRNHDPHFVRFYFAVSF